MTISTETPMQACGEFFSIKIYGDISLDEEVEDKFKKGDDKSTWLAINSGTVEMKDNKVIVLAD